MEQVIIITGILLIILGIFGIIRSRNLVKIVLAFTLFNTGLNILMISIGYIRNAGAPILSQIPGQGEIPNIVDPVPQALVLTAIVIGLGVTALMLAYVLKLYQDKGTLDINSFRDLKW